MKPLIPILVVLGVIATFAIDDPNTAMAKPTPSDLVITSDGVEDWRGRKLHYQLNGGKDFLIVKIMKIWSHSSSGSAKSSSTNNFHSTSESSSSCLIKLHSLASHISHLFH